MTGYLLQVVIDDAVAPPITVAASDSAAISVSETSSVFFADNFNRANGALGSQWVTTGTAPINIVSNQVVGGTSANAARYESRVVGKQISEFKFVGGTLQGPSVAMPGFAQGATLTSAGTWYTFRSQGATSGVAIGQKDAGGTAHTILASAAQNLVSGDIMRLEYDAGVLTAFINDVQVLTHTPTAPITNQFYVGISHGSSTQSGTALLDDWRGGTPYTSTAAIYTSIPKVIDFPFTDVNIAVGWNSDSYSQFNGLRDGGTRIHRSNDMIAPYGTPVYAVCAGTIDSSYMVGFTEPLTPGAGGGYQLRIDTPEGLRYVYAHFGPDTVNSEAQAFAPGIVPGATVVKGQLLGWVGESGSTDNSGPHLHFEIRDLTGVVTDDPTADYGATLGSEFAARYDPNPSLLDAQSRPAEALVLTSANDASALSVTETSLVSSPLSGTDTSSVAIAESRTLDVTVPRTDASSVAITETSNVSVTMAKTDTSAVGISESVSVSGTTAANDTSALSIIETATVAKTSATTDTGSISISESSEVMYYDDFNRADGPLGAPWVLNGASPTTIVSNRVNGGTAITAGRWGIPTQAKQVSELRFIGGNLIGPSVAMPQFAAGMGMSGSGTWYVFRQQGGTSGCAIGQKDLGAGTMTTLVSSPTNFASGDVVRLEYENGVLRAYINGNLTLTHTPVAPITGQNYIGFYHNSNSQSGTALFDDWRGGVPDNSVTSDIQASDTSAITITETATIASAAPGTDVSAITITEQASILVTQTASDTGALTITDNSALFINRNVTGSDTASIAVAESSATAVALAASDAGSLAITESTSSFITKTSNDSWAITVTESRALASSVTGSDTASLSVVETASAGVSVNGTDTSAVGIDETTSGFVTAAASDTAALSIADDGETSASIAGSDTANLAITETSSVVVFGTTAKTGSDTASLTITESTAQKALEDSADASAISITETVSVSSVGTASDTASLAIGESTNVVVSVTASDTAALSIAESRALAITRLQNRTESVALTITEASSLLALANANDAGRLEITETASIFVVVSASDQASLMVTESASVSNPVTASDDLVLSVEEDASVVISGLTVKTARDSISLSITEESNITVPTKVLKAYHNGQWVNGVCKVFINGEWKEAEVKHWRSGSWS